MTQRVVVVGAGIMGAATAYHLARRGARTLLLEQHGIAGGTTGASFGRLSAFDKVPETYFHLNRLGIEEHARLAASLPEHSWYHPCGSLIWEHDRDTLDERAARFQRWGDDLRWVSRQEARELVGAQVRLPVSVDRFLHAAREGWVDPVACTRSLVDAAREHGTEVRTGCAVERLDQASGGWQVVLRSGEKEQADAVVNAAGRSVSALAPGEPRALRLVRSRGFLCEIASDAVDLDRILHTDRVSLRPAGRHRLLARSDEIDRALLACEGDPDSVMLDAAARELLRRSRDVLPAIGERDGCRVAVGSRVMPRGGLPSIGGVPELPGYHHIASHSGVILAPLIGRLMAELITTGRLDRALAEYQP